MAINTSNGIVYSAPRTIRTNDTRGTGCPSTAADGSLLMSQTITVDNPSVYWTHGRIIFIASAAGKIRADINLRVDGTIVKNALNTTTNSSGTAVSAWNELFATYMGTLSAGTHTIAVYGSNGSNCWGCSNDGSWGNIYTLVWEAQ